MAQNNKQADTARTLSYEIQYKSTTAPTFALRADTTTQSMDENITEVESEPSGEEEAEWSSWHLVGRSKLDLRGEPNEEREDWSSTEVSEMQMMRATQCKLMENVRCEGESR